MSIILLGMPLLSSPGFRKPPQVAPRDVGCSSGAGVHSPTRGWGNGSPHLKNRYKRERDTLFDYNPQARRGDVLVKVNNLLCGKTIQP